MRRYWKLGGWGGEKGGGVPRDPGGCNGKIMDADKVGKKLFVNKSEKRRGGGIEDGGAHLTKGGGGNTVGVEENCARGRVIIRELCTALRKMANEEETRVKEKRCCG